MRQRTPVGFACCSISAGSVSSAIHLNINNMTAAEIITNVNRLLPHPQPPFFCIVSFSIPSFPPFTFSLWSVRSFHQPPTLFFSYMLSLSLFSYSVSLSQSPFITSGVQLAGNVDATTKNDVINYLGRDYVIKLLHVCAPYVGRVVMYL